MEQDELHLALTEVVERELHALLFPGGDDTMPERGVIALAFPSVGRRRTTLLVRQLIEPREGDVVWDGREGLLFAPGYKSRAADLASGVAGAGLIILHTHPGDPESDRAPGPSPQDLAADARDLFHLGQTLPAGAALAAGIIAPNGLWSARSYRFSFPESAEQVGRAPFRAQDAVVTRATAVRVVGQRLRKLPTEVGAKGPAGATADIDLHAQDSSIQLWNEAGQRMLAAIRVGQTGLGGVGGILAEHLPRLGVGGDVMLDFDRIKRQNLNRSQGATRVDASVRRLKVEVGARLARESSTAPQFEVRPIEGSVVEAEYIPDLLDCDVILNGADSPWARQVLDHLAYAHLIPVINGGTEFRTDTSARQVRWGKSDVNLAGPGLPCLQCQGSYDLRAVTEAQEHPRVRGERGYLGPRADAEPEERAPSVISNNALVAALMELRFQALVLGTTPEVVSGTQRHHPFDGTVEWAAVPPACRTDCGRNAITGLGDTYVLPTGVDFDFQVAREEWKEFELASVPPDVPDGTTEVRPGQLAMALRRALTRLKVLRRPL